MATERQMTGYIWGREQVDNADLSYYEKAKHAKTPMERMYYYQRVFHGKPTGSMPRGPRDHAWNLVQEMTQKLRRKGVWWIGMGQEVVVSNDSRIRYHSVPYRLRRSVLVQDPSVMVGRIHEIAEDAKFEFKILLEEVMDQCDEQHVKYLGYVLVKTGLYTLIDSWDGLETLHTEVEYIQEAIENSDPLEQEDELPPTAPAFHINKHMRTRYQAEKAAVELHKMVAH